MFAEDADSSTTSTTDARFLALAEVLSVRCLTPHCERWHRCTGCDEGKRWPLRRPCPGDCYDCDDTQSAQERRCHKRGWLPKRSWSALTVAAREKGWMITLNTWAPEHGHHVLIKDIQTGQVLGYVLEDDGLRDELALAAAMLMAVEKEGN